MLIAFAVVTATATWVASRTVPRHVTGITGGDFMQFWCAANILVSGNDPYDTRLQAHYSREQGWDRQVQGHGKFDFMPYYYPPWLGLVCIGLLPLGFQMANMLWIVLQFEAALISGFLIQRVFFDRSLRIALLFIPCFALTVQAARMGQIAPSILLAVVASCRLSQIRWDRSAGFCLAWLLIKPQATALFVFVALVWAFRQQRWRLIKACVMSIIGFVLVSTAVVPGWLPSMLNAPLETPLVTVDKPWLANHVVRNVADGRSHPNRWLRAVSARKYSSGDLATA